MSIARSFLSDNQTKFIFLWFSLVVWLICLPLFQDGMFLDGTQYAAISRNLARGVGSFWFPVLAQNSVAGLDTFHEHPPLVFFLQSIYFKLFGLQNIFPERLYCLTTFLITSFFIVKIWMRVFADDWYIKKSWWMPLIIWILMPIVFWSYTNNIQENTVSVFTTTSVYFLIRAVQKDRIFARPFFYIACFCIVLAFFSKGLPGLFPIAFFLIYWISERKISLFSATIYTFITLFFFVIVLILVLQYKPANGALHIWFFDRMLKRIASDPVVGSHFSILKGLMSQLLLPIVTAALLIFINRTRKIESSFNMRYFTFFVLIGAAGSLPLMLTLVQRNFYFTPSLPFFAIALALPVSSGLKFFWQKPQLFPRLNQSITVLMFALFISGGVVAIFKAGNVKRDNDLLSDVYSVGRIIPENSFTTATQEVMWGNWQFRCYMMRYNSISFTEVDSCDYMITTRSKMVGDKYEEIDEPLHLFSLYKRKY